MGGDDRPDALAALITLADPMRRRLYDYVAGRDGPVRRDEAAASVGISRTLAAYHLDRLAEAGLLATSYARRDGQGGPGAGRPAKCYERARDEVTVTLPPRSYELLARLLIDAVGTDTTGQVTTALMAAAEAEGRAAGADGVDLMTALRSAAYEPVETATGTIQLRNCPFRQLAHHQTSLVCGLNHALVRGVVAGCGHDPGRAELAPQPGSCCVVIRPAPVTTSLG